MQIEPKTFSTAKPVRTAEDILRDFEGAIVEIVTFDDDGHTTVRQIDLSALLDGNDA